MWSYRKILRPLAVAVSLSLGASLLSACSFTPLYGENSAVGTSLDLAYADPSSRLDQIIYQDLALRLGQTRSADAPLVSVSTSRSNRRVGRTSSDSPSTTYEATITATVTVTRARPAEPVMVMPPAKPGKTAEIIPAKADILYTVSRKASATYSTNDQRLANQQASEEAAERAALSVAQTLRLLLAANLPAKL